MKEGEEKSNNFIKKRNSHSVSISPNNAVKPIITSAGIISKSERKQINNNKIKKKRNIFYKINGILNCLWQKQI